MDTPVLLLVFNRPEPTRNALDAIRRAAPKRLYVAGDGARADRAGEIERVRITREIATSVDWDCEVKTLFRDTNLGCKRAVSGALDWFFAHEPEGIVLEDDIAPTDEFFPFCVELLERYRHDDRVGIIGGLNPVPAASLTDDSYIFTRYPSIWGWASWARTWQGYQVDMQSWTDDDAPQRLTKILDGRGPAIRYWRNNFDAVARGDINTWAYPFVWHCWRRDLVSILPTVSLCDNIGFGADATHTTGTKPRQLRRPNEDLIFFPMKHPDNRYATRVNDIRIERKWYKISGIREIKKHFMSSIRRKLRSIF